MYTQENNDTGGIGWTRSMYVVVPRTEHGWHGRGQREAGSGYPAFREPAILVNARVSARLGGSLGSLGSLEKYAITLRQA